MLTLENGDNVFDCSLREPFNSKLIIEKIKKRWSELEGSARNFASHFGRKAYNDLGEYDFVKAKHAENLQDLLDRPSEDILAEEFIDSLPLRTVVEEMEVDDPPAPTPAPSSSAKQEVDSMEVDASSSAKKPRVSSEQVSMEGSSFEEGSVGQPGSRSKPVNVEGSSMGEGSTRPPKPSAQQAKVEGSSVEEESTPPPKMEPTAEEAKKKVRQGVWGDTTTTVLPEAYELLEEDPEADSTPGRLDPQPTNEELVVQAKASDEVSLIKKSVEFCSYRDQKLDLEAKSPIKLLRLQRHGGPHVGFYHDNCRDDPVVAFKLWHMCYRTQNAAFPAQRPYEKYRANETQVFQLIAKMGPVYMGRVSKNDIVFRAGDLRSTYDEDLLEKSSDAGLRIERAHKKLYEKLLSEGGTREQLQNAMLHYFLACKITAEEAGDLILEDEKAYRQGNIDIMQDGPLVYASKEACPFSPRTWQLRGRKKTVPAKYAQFVDRKDDSGVGPLVKSLARSKNHIICLLEALNLDIEEVAYLVRHGWCMQSNKGHDICIMTRANMSGEYVEHLAAQGQLRSQMFTSVFRCPIGWWKSGTAELLHKRPFAKLEAIFRTVSVETTWKMMSNDAECRVFRECAFHMSAKIASKKPALMREAMGIMLADCFHYQVDYITGDANMACYRSGWKTSSASPGRMWARSTGNPFPAWIAWWRSFLSGRTQCQWRDGLRPRTQLTSARSASPNGCCTATGMCTCFRIPTATLTLLSWSI